MVASAPAREAHATSAKMKNVSLFFFLTPFPAVSHTPLLFFLCAVFPSPLLLFLSLPPQLLQPRRQGRRLPQPGDGVHPGGENCAVPGSAGGCRLEWGTTRSLSCCSHRRHPSHHRNLRTAASILPGVSPRPVPVPLRPVLSCPCPRCRPSTARFATTPRRTSLFRFCRPSSTCTSWREAWHTYTRRAVSLAARTQDQAQGGQTLAQCWARARSYACARHVLQQWQDGGKTSRRQFGWTLNSLVWAFSFFWLSLFCLSVVFFFFCSPQCATVISSLRMCFSTPRRPTRSCATLEGERTQREQREQKRDGRRSPAAARFTPSWGAVRCLSDLFARPIV